MNLLIYNHLRNIYGSTGVGRVARELTEHLALRQDVNLKILADRGDHAAMIDKLGQPWTGFQYRFIAHETSRQQMQWYLTDHPAAETYWPDAEIVYCTAESYVPVRRAKLVVTSHDMQLFEPQAHTLTPSLLKQRAKWWLLFRRLQRKVDLFHAISTFSAERLAHYFPHTRGRIAVVPNAVSQAFFEPPTASGMQVLLDLNLATRPYVLIPGGLSFRKNADLILRAWPRLRQRCPSLTLVVTSHNSPQYLARAREMEPSLILCGYQSAASLVALYAHAQAVWFPSRYEGFGMPVLEAMACGTPVVASNASAVPEVAGGAATLLDPNDPDQHAHALEALLSDPEARAEASRKGIRRAAQFTWNSSASMLMEQFDLIR